MKRTEVLLWDHDGVLVDTERWYFQEPGFAKSAHHVWVVTFTDDGLDLEAIGLDGDVLDRHTIRARRPKKAD